MPRDGTFTPSDDILDTLISARAKFTGPDSWFKNGLEAFEGSNYGTSDNFNCIGTAIRWDDDASNYLMELVTGKSNDGHLIACWNNAPSLYEGFADQHRTYEDVIDLLDRAIEKRRAMVGELVA